ncbi:hypothetical protein J3D60_001268 [Pseudomonas sp. S3E17]|nr:hypothetical protein [Pseudomonas sp. S3E17]
MIYPRRWLILGIISSGAYSAGVVIPARLTLRQP